MEVKPYNITVALLGIPNTEKKRLHAMFSYSKTRSYFVYSEVKLHEMPNIIIVNADDTVSLIQWEQHRESLHDKGETLPVSILMSRARRFKTKHHQIQRPLIVSKILTILDDIVVNEFGLNIKDYQTEIAQYRDSAEVLGTKKLLQQAAKQEITALVVDDNLPTRIQMSMALEPFLSRIDFAKDIKNATELAGQHYYHIIFIDISISDGNGYKLCKQLRTGKYQGIPMIMMGNARTDENLKQQRLARGDTFLIKPINQTIIKEIIAEYLYDLL